MSSFISENEEKLNLKFLTKLSENDFSNYLDELSNIKRGNSNLKFLTILKYVYDNKLTNLSCHSIDNFICKIGNDNFTCYTGCEYLCKLYNGSTLLHWFAYNNDLDNMKAFLDKNNYISKFVDLTVEDKHGATPIKYAVQEGYVEMTKLLLDYDINLFDENLLNSAFNDNNADLILYLKECRDKKNKLQKEQQEKELFDKYHYKISIKEFYELFKNDKTKRTFKSECEQVYIYNSLLTCVMTYMDSTNLMQEDENGKSFMDYAFEDKNYLLVHHINSDIIQTYNGNIVLDKILQKTLSISMKNYDDYCCITTIPTKYTNYRDNYFSADVEGFYLFVTENEHPAYILDLAKNTFKFDLNLKDEHNKSLLDYAMNAPKEKLNIDLIKYLIKNKN